MKKDDQLIEKMLNGILITNVISIVAGIACVMIDSIVTGQFLGEQAVAASGLIQPVVMTVNLVGGLVIGGLGVACTKYMGKAQHERVNQVYSIVAIACFLVMALMGLVLYIASPWLGRFLGARTKDETIMVMISDYLRGFSYGLIPNRFTIMLSSIMMLDNDKNRSIMAMGATLVSDVVFDLANVLIFHGGMYGMAIATSLSGVVGFAVIMTHYLRKNRVIHFTLKGLRLSDMYDVMLFGVPNAASMGSQALRTFCFNGLLLSIADSSAVAALAVGNSAFSIVHAVMIGFILTSSMFSRLLYSEEDRTGLEQGITISMRKIVVISAVINILMFLFPQPVARLFVRSTDPSVLIQGARYIRFMAVQCGLFTISYPIGGAYQGMGRLDLNYLVVFMREGILPILSVMLCGTLFGIRGMEMGFAISGALVLALCILIAIRYNGKFPKAPKDFLIFPKDFGAAPEELFEASAHSMDDVVAVSEGVFEFCKERGTDRRTAMLFALFVEEMANNTLSHGLSKGKSGSINLRLICKEKEKVIRLRDDGRPFDPVEWFKKNSGEDPSSAMGIRMVVKLAKEVQYMAAMEMNNLIVKL